MFALTARERNVLIAIGIVILIGSILRSSGYRPQHTRENPVSTSVPESRLQAEGVPVVNINRAGPQELQRLPGIGSAYAARIVEYRQKYGAFASLEDLEKVSGIGKKKIERLKPYITF